MQFLQRIHFERVFLKKNRVANVYFFIFSTKKRLKFLVRRRKLETCKNGENVCLEQALDRIGNTNLACCRNYNKELYTKSRIHFSQKFNKISMKLDIFFLTQLQLLTMRFKIKKHFLQKWTRQIIIFATVSESTNRMPKYSCYVLNKAYA